MLTPEVQLFLADPNSQYSSRFSKYFDHLWFACKDVEPRFENVLRHGLPNEDKTKFFDPKEKNTLLAKRSKITTNGSSPWFTRDETFIQEVICKNPLNELNNYAMISAGANNALILVEDVLFVAQIKPRTTNAIIRRPIRQEFQEILKELSGL